MFYPDIKPHISPSALDNWHNSRGLFIKSYFMGEKSPETAAMKAGKQIHALIEAGILDVYHSYEFNEKTLTNELDFEFGKVKVLGIPDSYNPECEFPARFVDYKSGRENTWDNAKLATNLKMKTTAWLVWNATGKPKVVEGYIEYIPTQWNPATREVEPVGGESIVAGECIYTAEDLESFTDFIKKTIEEINATYEEWLLSSDEFIDQTDVVAYAELDVKKNEIIAQMDAIKERIGSQMGQGKKDTISTPFGTFYFTNKKTYEYPATLAIKYVDLDLLQEDVDKINTALKVAQKKFEQENEPVKVARSLSFRAKK